MDYVIADCVNVMNVRRRQCNGYDCMTLQLLYLSVLLVGVIALCNRLFIFASNNGIVRNRLSWKRNKCAETHREITSAFVCGLHSASVSVSHRLERLHVMAVTD